MVGYIGQQFVGKESPVKLNIQEEYSFVFVFHL